MPQQTTPEDGCPGRLGDFYRRDVRTVPAGEPLAEVADLLRREATGALLVVEADRLAGIITEQDLERAVGDKVDLRACTAADYLNPRLAAVRLDDDPHEVAAMMRELHVRHLPVVRGDEVIGMVSAHAAA
jgi:CBS domain-containing protein